MATSFRIDDTASIEDEFGFEECDDDNESSSTALQQQRKPSQVTPSSLLQEEDDSDVNRDIQYSGSKRPSSSSAVVPSLARKELFPQQGLAVASEGEVEEISDPLLNPSKKKRLFRQEEEDDVPTYSQLLPTQPLPIFSQESNTTNDDDDKEESDYFLIDNYTNTQFPIKISKQQQHVFTFGRWNCPKNNIICPSAYIGRLEHAQLIYDPMTLSFNLQTAEKHSCWIMNDDNNNNNNTHWQEIPPNSSHPVNVGGTFRLLPINMMMMMPDDDKERNADDHDESKVQFTLYQVMPVGSASFDQQYLTLLWQLQRNGKLQKNEKGNNWTLSDPFSFVLDLRCHDKNLLPLSTLRYMYQGKPAIIEALWYLRGENHISFLQKLGQKFWDKQAKQDTGWVGYNYGLLTNCDGVNQLEKNVISRLVQHESSSRNMVCSLINPNQKTVQNSCTTAVQFAVSHNDNKEYLDLTVEQRSSDVMLGLPHDVVVWTVILHLVRREVHRRSGRQLHAGRVFFNIAAGGAHVYMLNKDNFIQLLHHRKPKRNVEPELIMNIDKSFSMFEFAKSYGDKKSEARGYGKELMENMNSCIQ